MIRISTISIRNQIVALIILMTLISFGVILYTSSNQQEHDIEEAVDMNTLVANQIRSDQNILLAGAEQLVTTLSLLPIVQNHDAAAVSTLLGTLLKSNPHFNNIIIVDKAGSLWASAITSKTAFSYADRRYFKQAIASGGLSSGEFTVGKISAIPVLSFAWPIKDRSGEISDVLAVVFPLDRYSRLYGAEFPAPISSILLLDHKGTILFSSADAKLVGKQDRPDLFARMTEGPDSGTFEDKGNLGFKQFLSYQKLRLKNESVPYMYIRTGLSREHVLTKARKDFFLGAIIMLPGMLLMLTLAFFFCKQGILNKIRLLIEITKEITGGNLSVRVPDNISGGELGELGSAFNEMAQKLMAADDEKRKSEKKYRDLVENANSIIMKLDAEGRITFFNEFAQSFFGYSEAEILGNSVIGTIVPATDSGGRNMQEMVRNIYENSEVNTHNINENSRKNGDIVWVSWSNHALLDTDGKKTGILSIGQDITAQMKAEEKLKRSEQRFRSFVENINDVLFALTPNGIFSYVSPNWTTAFGYEPEETIGQAFIPFVHPDDVSGCMEFMHRTFETGNKQSGVEYRVRCKDGKHLWYKANASLITDPYTGTVTLVGIGRDITEIRHAEQVLRQSEEMFSSVFHASPDAIILSRLHDGMILNINENFTKLTGFTSDELIGKTSLEVNLWQNPAERAHLEANVRKHGEVKFFEAALTTKSGSRILGQISCRAINLDGTPYMISIVRDITEREYILSELIKAQKLESISILAGGIAHNFNNVLTGVIGYISYARKHLENAAAAQQALDAAERASYRASDLARQLLSFSQSKTSDKEPVSVDVIVRESVSLFLTGSNVTGNIECDSQQTVYIDSLQISQAFNNIVLNAVHSMPGGGFLSVRVKRCRLPDDNRYSLVPGNYVSIVFEDNGCGIEQKDLIKVFDPYFTTRDEGTGLGLSTTRSTIKNHAGHIDISSVVGEGTTVTILLPALPELSVENESKDGQPATSKAGVSILVMDDEEIIRDVIEEMLTGVGYVVTTCANGEEACDLYTEFRDAGEPFVLAILDLSVPNGMTGREAAQRILDIDPKACLIASSGYANDPAITDCAAFGFSASIAKPFNSDDLVQTILGALKSRLL